MAEPLSKGLTLPLEGGFNSCLTKQFRWPLMLFLILALCMTSKVIPSAFSQPSITGNSSTVFPIDSQPYNMTYGDWTDKWWQWSVSIPKDINPAGDMTGQYCNQKQGGPVWFLAGTYGGAATRSCTVPSGKAILVPLLNAQCNTLSNPNLKTDEDLMACAKSLNEGVTKLEATLDGAKTEALDKYRIQSPIFDLTYPPNNVDGAPPGTAKAASDGYWVMFKPLSVGNHTLHVSGGVQNFAEGALNNFETEVTYLINVS